MTATDLQQIRRQHAAEILLRKLRSKRNGLTTAAAKLEHVKQIAAILQAFPTLRN